MIGWHIRPGYLKPKFCEYLWNLISDSTIILGPPRNASPRTCLWGILSSLLSDTRSNNNLSNNKLRLSLSCTFYCCTFYWCANARRWDYTAASAAAGNRGAGITQRRAKFKNSKSLISHLNTKTWGNQVRRHTTFDWNFSICPGPRHRNSVHKVTSTN